MRLIRILAVIARLKLTRYSKWPTDGWMAFEPRSVVARSSSCRPASRAAACADNSVDLELCVAGVDRQS